MTRAWAKPCEAKPRICIDDFQGNVIRRLAEKAVRALYCTPMFKPEVIKHLQKDRSLPEAVKREALHLAEHWVESARLLDKAGFAVVRTIGLRPRRLSTRV